MQGQECSVYLERSKSDACFSKITQSYDSVKSNTCLINLFSLTTAKGDSIGMVPSTLSRASLWCVQRWIFFFFVSPQGNFDMF